VKTEIKETTKETTQYDNTKLTTKEKMEIFAKSVVVAKNNTSHWAETKFGRIFAPVAEPQTGAISTAAAEAILITIVLASVSFIVLAQMFGIMQTSNATIQANTATDAGTSTGKLIFNLLLWLIPLGCGLALLIMVIRNESK
jgi:hypothetical protein